MRNKSVHNQKRFAQNAFKCLLFVLLFSFVFASILVSLTSNELSVADAAAGTQAAVREATPQSVSSITNGTNVASAFNSSSNQNSTYAARFGVSSEVSNGVTSFGWNSAESKWGYTDWSDSDNASIWWLEFSFTGSALTDVKAGDVSYYASALIDFSNGINDESALAISFVGVHSQPHVNFISSSRSGNSASWSATGKNQTANRSGDSEWSETYSRTDTLGQTSFNPIYQVPKEATGIRFIFAAIADGAMDGGFTTLDLRFYKNTKIFVAKEDQIDTLAFNSSTQVSNYLQVLTKDDSSVASDMRFQFRSSISRKGNTYTFSKTNTYGAYAPKDGGDIELIAAVAIKIGSNKKKFYNVSGFASVALFVEGGGSATVTAKAAADLSNNGSIPSGLTYPSSQTSTNTSTTQLVTAEKSGVRGAYIGVKGGRDQAFSSAWAGGSARVTTTDLVVRGGTTFYIFVKLHSTDDRSTATTSRAVCLDSVSVNARSILTGEGTSASPFLLTNRNDFDSLSTLVSGQKEPFDSTYFKVQPTSGTYINMSKYANGNDAGVFTSIGTSTLPFMGNLDGNSKTLYGLTLSSTRAVSGLFAYVQGATISKLTIGTSTSYGVADIKGVVVGGIVGRVLGTPAVTISDCVVSAPVTGTGSGTGGIVGSMAANSSLTVKNCSVTGAITSTGNGTGGILGYVARGANTINIIGCYCTGAISARVNVGGIAGRVETTRIYANSVVISNCYATKEISYNTDSSSSGGTVGGIVGYLYYSGASTANNTMIVKYCYREGVTSSNAAGVGGIVGVPRSWVDNSSSTLGDSRNVKIQNCYNKGEVSTSYSGTSKGVGGIVGAEDNSSNVYTVTDCWSVVDSTKLVENQDNVGSNPARTGYRIEHNFASGFAFHPLYGTTRGTWTSSSNGILSNNIDGFVLNIWNSTNLAVADGKYLSLTKENADGVYFSPNRAINSSGAKLTSNATASSTAFDIYVGYDAGSGANLYVCTLQIEPTTNLSSVYGDDIGDEGGLTGSFTSPYISSVDRNNYGKTNQIYNYSISYVDEIPVNVGTYAAQIDIVIDGVVVGRNNSIQHVVTPRPISFTPVWGTGSVESDTHKYIYNKEIQGLRQVNTSNILNESIDTVLTITESGGVQWSFNADTKSIVTSSVNANKYVLTVYIKDTNYKFDDSAASRKWEWEISPKNVNDITFGYGKLGENNKQLGLVIGGSTIFNGMFALDVAVSPYSIIYRDNNSVYSSVSSYLLYFGSTLLNIGVDYSMSGRKDGNAITIVSNDGESIDYGTDHFLSIEIDLTGKGNYTGTRTVRFTLMDSDFGGDITASDWGSELHPYVIEHDAHLLRLSQIVNGAQAWNSINSADTSVAMINNAGAVAKTRTYAGAYFRLGDNVSASTAGGFVPIGTRYGASDTLYRFAGSFDGRDKSGTQFTVTLTVDESGKEYVGLFGYVAGDLNTTASLSYIRVTGSVKGGNHTGGVVGLLGRNAEVTHIVNDGCSVTGSDYTGGLFGRLQGTSLTGVISTGTDSATFMNSGNVSGSTYVGGITGYAENNIGGVYNSGSVSGVENVGGIVGYAKNIILSAAKSSAGSVEGVTYIGGNIGYADGVTIADDVVAASNVRGYGYIGGMVGYIRITAPSQIVASPENTAVMSSVSITGTGNYVGGYAGWADASECDGFSFAPYISNAQANPITISGANYVGGIFGGFVGKGYKRTSADLSDTDSVIYIRNNNASGNPYIYTNITLKGGRVAGGLFGYVSGVGVVFMDNWIVANHTNFTFSGATSFFGGIVGVLGENATVESAVQLSDGGIEIGGQTVYLRYSSDIATISNNGDFVGTLFGYIASTAGKYVSSDTTVLGNNIQMLNSRTSESTGGVSITGKGYVGGLIGAIGRVESYGVSGDTLLSNLLTYGRYDATVNTVVNSTVRLAPIDDNGNGKLINRGKVVANENYAGGIVGYAGSGSLLAFVNNTAQSGVNVNAASSYLNVFNGYSEDITSGSASYYIQAKNYAGGLVGYVSSAMHNFEHVVSTMFVVAGTSTSSATGDYAGGLIGYMGGGRVSGSIAGYGATSTSSDSVRGNSYVGGLVGRLAGGQVVNSVGYGFSFDRVSSLNGGVVGAIDAGTSVTASWTVYVATSPTYSTKSVNSNGKYVIIDKNVLSSRLPNAKEYAVMTGVIATNVTITSSATMSGVNNALSGKLSIRTSVPTNNKQLVYYDVSGTDTSTDNVFDVFKYSGGDIYYRLDMATSSNFSICIVDIEFKDIQICKSSDQTTQNNTAKAAYRVPASKNEAYTILVNASFDWNTTGYIKSLSAQAYYENGNNICQVGSYSNNNFNVGGEATPYVISSLSLWRDFIAEVKKGSSFSGKHVKLATDLAITSENDLAGNLTGQANGFNGTFDGDGHTIDINLPNSSMSALGAFPFAHGATFKNLTVSGTISSTSGSAIAAFVGEAQGNLTFVNCTSAATIKALHSAGGFVGSSNGYQLNFVTCVNTGNITTTEGTNENYENYSKGTGGLVGVLSASGSLGDVRFESCKNSGKITGGNNVGGIVGLSNGTGASATLGLEIFNTANTGAVTANNGLSSEPNRTHALSYAGGIIGKSGNYGYIRMYSSFNSGTIVTYGSICGGLVGGVGEFILMRRSTPLPLGTDSRCQIHQGGESIIAYCYNNGEVHCGGTTSNGKKSDPFGGGKSREALNGSIVGGIAGCLGWGQILYCYNTGGVHCYQVVGEYKQWQNRMGGILGQAQPSQPSGDVHIIINYCYNLGLCTAEFYQDTQYLFDFSGDSAYGASICGFMDTGDDYDENATDTDTQKARLQPKGTTYYNYVLKDNLHYNNRSTGNNAYFTGVMNGEGTWGWISTLETDKGRYVDGTVVDNVALLTTYHTSSGNGYSVKRAIGPNSDNQAATLIDTNGNYRANYDPKTYKVTYDSDFLSGTMQGYVYIYGCLPQLAMFSMDTKEGLSMLSVSFGKDEYDDWQGAQAGSKESPYIIKDGIGLLAMSTLLRAKSGSATYTFHDKHIEFANGENNIDSMNAAYINMDMDPTVTNAMKSGTNDSTYTQYGKNYFLYNNGALGRAPIQHNATENKLRDTWVGYNYYHNGSGYTTGANFYNSVNFYPIGTGGASSFEGSISGAHYTRNANGEITATTNTEIRKLKVSQAAGDSFAGLFGSVYDAEISNLTVSGTVKAYGTSNTIAYYVFAGGIAGYAGGNTVISDCRVGVSSTNSFTLGTYALSDSTKSGINIKSFAGGIVGAAGPRKGETVEGSGIKHLVIRNCHTTYAEINAVRNNSGGIAGYAGDPWGKMKDTNNVVEFDNLYVYANTTVSTLSGVTDSTTVSSTDVITFGAGSNVGGIVGSNDGIVRFDISKAYVGHTSSLGVTVSGENSVGGVIGTARGSLDITDATISRYATVVRNNNWGDVENITENGVDYGTAIGGVIGRSIKDTSNFLYGNIVFEGKINVPVGTKNGETKNIGGIIGAMGTGTQFQSGSNVSVAKPGSITAAVGKGYLFNIGGIAGVTLDGAFDGTFTVNITMSLQNASRVGGLIGYNKGETHILASDTGTVINIGAAITGASEVGGLIGQNGEVSGSDVASGSLQIGADMYKNTPYQGSVTINILAEAQVKGDSNSDGESNVGGIVGLNKTYIVITKGDLTNNGTISASKSNVGGIVGNNDGYINMGGSSVTGASLTIRNNGSVSSTGGDNVGGVIGYLRRGTIAGTFVNYGSVAGVNYVGGSIGRVDAAATLTAAGTDTYFYNGATYVASTSTDEALAAASESGTVTGSGNYVGGSIGALFGKIEGVGNAEVYFVNAGTVNGVNYVGGNIGMLAGAVSATQFINSGSVESSGSTAIGGSVGLIGVEGTSIAHTEISVNGVHFEFSGGGGISVTGSGSTGGVGGAIGIIGGEDEGFGSGSNWNNVTMYAASDISASSVMNVGGAIGLIKANDIVIRNMLAFYTSISGSENVGGIIGRVEGSGIRVVNSFNIEGTVVGNNAGGIIGLAAADTDASTSYWFKGYKNEELMTLNINNIAENLGKYTAVSIGNVVFTEDLTSQYGTPFDYTGDDADKNKTWETYLSENMGGKPVSKQNGVWAVTNTSWTKYTTGSESTGWYYVYANNREGLDVTHTVSNNEKQPSVLESAAEKEAELVYWKRIANAYTEAERAKGDDVKELTSPIVADIDEGAKTATSGGRPQERHIYAAALASTVSGYYLYMDASGIKPGVYKSTEAGDEHFYINAITAGNAEGTIASPSENVAVYYRSVSVGRPLIYNGYNRYVPITDEVSSGVRIQYISVNEAGEPNVSEIDRTKGDYIYTVTEVRDATGAVKNEFYESDTYYVDISIYYYDSFGKLEEIGGIANGKYSINKLPLDVRISSSNGEYNGSQTTGSLTVTINGVTLLDDTAQRAVQFAFSGEYKESDGTTRTIRNDDVNISTLINNSKKTWSYAERGESQAFLPLGTSKLYLSEISVVRSKDITDVNYIRDDRYLEDAKDYCVTLTFKFTERIVDGKLKAHLYTSGTSENYKADDVEATFAVTPKKITISITGATTGHYNGSAYKTSFAFEGWAPDHDGAATQFVNDFMPYVVFIPRLKKVTGTPIGSSSNVWDLANNRTYDLSSGNVTYTSLTWYPNINSINADGMKLEGSYQIGFATTNSYDGKPATADGNYYLEITDNPLEYFSVKENTLTLTWGNNNATYNAQKHDYIATMTAAEAFASTDLLAYEVETLFPDGYNKYEYKVQGNSTKTAQIIFKVGPNAGTYSVSLPHRKTEDSEPSTENCSINATTGTFTIAKLALTVGLSGNVTELYNGGYHTAEKIVAQSPDSNANPTWVYDNINGMYTLTMFGGTTTANTAADNQVNILLSYNDGVAAVNVGSYVATLKDENVIPVGADNFTVSASGSGSIVIQPAVVTFTWGSKTTFTYNRNAQGRTLTAALTTAGEGLKFTSTAYTPSVSGATLHAAFTNAIGNRENIRVPVSGVAASIDAGNYEAEVNTSSITVTSTTNAAGTVQKSNYTFKFADGQTQKGAYTIDPLVISSVSVTGNKVSKVYDATTEVPSENVGTPVFGGLGTVAPPTSYSVNALYDSAQVGSRIITYTFTLTGTDAKNFRLNNRNSLTYTRQYNGSITAREIVVTLDMLRNRRATRVYNAGTAYGGAGVTNTFNLTGATSAIHRSGEGFAVSGFALKEASGAVIISAAYAEATSGRTAFDGYVNNVTGSGANLVVGSAQHGESGYYYKNLIFTMSGTSATNYTFTVKVGSVNVGDKTGSGGANGAVTVKDSSNGGLAGIIIEITANVFKASYTNTAQSYANADNSYNTNWLEIGGTVDAVGGDSLRLEVVNNWMYEGNDERNPMRVYKSYTVIRGSENSKILSARVASNDGVHVNYKLGNQPVLTIGYFVETDEFEVGSLASLMIATYYYSVSKTGGSDEFGQIIAQAIWQNVATVEEYNSGQCNKEITDSDGNVTVITDWNEYFEYLASEEGGSHYIFLNTYEEEGGWGYYYVDENSKPQQYDKFKQIANISGVITAQDIAILDGMFRKTSIDGEGNVIEEKSYDWGVGKQYLTNFVKAKEGNVITAMGSIFAGAFGGVYDGNGYTIDKFNIVGVAGAEGGYYGMFESIDSSESVGEVKNVHLRNVNILVSGGAGTVYVGAIAGDSMQQSVSNVSVHGVITVKTAGTAYVGGLFGRTSGTVDGAIVLGNMSVKAGTAYVGGAVGECTGISNVVSLMQMDVTSGNATAGPIAGKGDITDTNAFMKNSVWVNKTAVSGGYTYSELMAGSVSGYGTTNKYYYIDGQEEPQKGVYDVLSDVRLTALDGDSESRTNAHESMRLADIVDIYVLMYSKTKATTTVEGKSVDVFGRSIASPLVGSKHGTDKAGDAIVIGNSQGVALLKELRFATFTVERDIYMSATYRVTTASGAFYGSIQANGHFIYVSKQSNVKMFETEVATDGSSTPSALIKQQ